ncbi:ubiquitin-conjugating enzyme E2 N [Pelomyxa schiedti]|nr:ubiquitin-conjugating enzyme E2 N [Pelomyxa schiedti]
MCIFCQLFKLLGRDPDKTDTTFQLPEQCRGFTNQLLDSDALQYLSGRFRQGDQDAIPQVLVPFHTTGDGNCLLHAVSMAMWGTEMYYNNLRTLMADEMTSYKEWYLPKVLASEWEMHLQRASKTNEPLEFIHVQALANAIQRPIIIFRGEEDVIFGEGGGGVTATFLPLRRNASECFGRPIPLAWNHKQHIHFVPLLTYLGTDYSFTELPALFLSDNVEQQQPDVNVGELLQAYVRLRDPIKPPKIQSLIAQMTTFQLRSMFSAPLSHEEIVASWEKERNPDDNEYYDLVVPLVVADRILFLPYNFTDDIGTIVVQFLTKHKLTTASMPQFATKLEIHMRNAIAKAVERAATGIRTQENTWIPNTQLANMGKPLPSNFINVLHEYNANCSMKHRFSFAEESAIAELVALMPHCEVGDSRVSPILSRLPMEKMLDFPWQIAFPVLDIFRILLSLPDTTNFLQYTLGKSLLPRCLALVPKEGPLQNHLVFLRIICNAARYSFFIRCIYENMEILEMVQWVAEQFAEEMSIRAAVSCILLNLASSSIPAALSVLHLLNKMLNIESNEKITLTLVIATGTLLHNNCAQLRAAMSFDILSKLQKHKSTTNTKLVWLATVVQNMITKAMEDL